MIDFDSTGQQQANKTRTSFSVSIRARPSIVLSFEEVKSIINTHFMTLSLQIPVSIDTIGAPEALSTQTYLYYTSSHANSHLINGIFIFQMKTNKIVVFQLVRGECDWGCARAFAWLSRLDYHSCADSMLEYILHFIFNRTLWAYIFKKCTTYNLIYRRPKRK